MPGVSNLGTGATNTYSWLAVDSTLPFTVRINDRRTGIPFVWTSNSYIVRIGATSGVSGFVENRFTCPAGQSGALAQPAPGLCRT